MLKLAVENIEDVEEAFRPLYAEKDGKFQLKVDGIEDSYVPRDVLKKANDESAARRKELEAWKKIGKSEDEIKELIAAAEKADHDKAKRAGDFDKLRDAMKTQHDKELHAERERVQAMQKTVERYLVDAQATTAIAQAKGSADLLLPHVQRHVKVVEEGGNYIAQVVDAKGEPRLNGKGDPMTISDLVGEMRQSDIYGRAFEGSGQTGSGMRPGSTSGGTSQPKTITRAAFNELPPTEQRAKALGGFQITES